MATNDILTLAEAKRYVSVNTADTDKDVLLAAAITAVSTKLDHSVGPVVYATITGEVHDGGDGSHARYDRIYLDYSPVGTVTQVLEYDGTTAATLTAQSNTSQTANQYAVDRVTGKLSRRDSNMPACFPQGLGNVVVTYVAGRFTAGTITDDRYKAAAGLMLQNWWRTEQPALGNVGEFDVPQVNFPTFAVPKAVKDLLADQWRSESGF